LQHDGQSDQNWEHQGILTLRRLSTWRYRRRGRRPVRAPASSAPGGKSRALLSTFTRGGIARTSARLTSSASCGASAAPYCPAVNETSAIRRPHVSIRLPVASCALIAESTPTRRRFTNASYW
jgi:hypothetical protein